MSSNKTSERKCHNKYYLQHGFILNQPLLFKPSTTQTKKKAYNFQILERGIIFFPEIQILQFVVFLKSLFVCSEEVER